MSKNKVLAGNRHKTPANRATVGTSASHTQTEIDMLARFSGVIEVVTRKKEKKMVDTLRKNKKKIRRSIGETLKAVQAYRVEHDMVPSADPIDGSDTQNLGLHDLRVQDPETKSAIDNISMGRASDMATSIGSWPEEPGTIKPKLPDPPMDDLPMATPVDPMEVVQSISPPPRLPIPVPNQSAYIQPAYKQQAGQPNVMMPGGMLVQAHFTPPHYTPPSYSMQAWLPFTTMLPMAPVQSVIPHQEQHCLGPTQQTPWPPSQATWMQNLYASLNCGAHMFATSITQPIQQPMQPQPGTTTQAAPTQNMPNLDNTPPNISYTARQRPSQVQIPPSRIPTPDLTAFADGFLNLSPEIDSSTVKNPGASTSSSRGK